MVINGKKRREIREALVAAFPMPKDLRMVTDEVLNVPLQNITGIGGDMETMAFELIAWAQARGRLTELVIGAATVNPTSPRLKSIADQFQLASSAEGEIERINLHDAPFENVAQWLEKFSQLRYSICRIEPQPEPDTNGYGTGFLVAADVILTNYHVIEPFVSSGSGSVVARFDYATTTDGVTVSAGRTSKLAADWRLFDSPVMELDFALVRLAEPVANDAVPNGVRGKIAPTRKTPNTSSPVIILQHPEAKPLKMAIGSVVVDPNAPANRLSYTVNTEPGSSGSPCFNSGLELVALHHWGASPNRGVRLSAIMDFLAEPQRRADIEKQGLAHLIG